MQIVLVDPVRVGGPEAVRMWATAADLDGVELALLAHDDTAEAVHYAAHLAATLRACTQPLVIGPASAAHVAGRLTALSHCANAARRNVRPSRASRCIACRCRCVSSMSARCTCAARRNASSSSWKPATVRAAFGETNGTDEVLQSCARMAQKLIGQDPLDRLRLRQAMAGPTVGSRNGLADWAGFGRAGHGAVRLGRPALRPADLAACSAAPADATSRRLRIFPRCCWTNRWIVGNCLGCSPIPACIREDRRSCAASAARSRLHRVQGEMHRHQPGLGCRASCVRCGPPSATM